VSHNARGSRTKSNALRAAVIIACAACAPRFVNAAEQPTLAATVIDGVSTYSASELFAIYREELGRPISSAAAQAIVAQIEALYLRDGYSRPELRIDAQLAAEGVLRIEVFEARVTRVEFSGDQGPYSQALERIGIELSEHAPLRPVDLQRAIQRMRELPGLSVRASTRRDELQRNAYALIVEANYQPIDGAVELSNRGTSQIGPVFASGQLVANNLLGLQERLGLLFSSATDAEEFFGAGVFIDARVSDAGAHLTTTAFASRSNPTEPIDRDDRYLRERASLRAVQPIGGDSASRIALSVGLDFDDLELMRSNRRLRMERLRIAELGGRLNGAFTPRTPYLFALQVRKGLDGLGASLYAPDLAADPRRLDFTSVRVQFTQLYRFAKRWTARLDGLAQQSAYVLPDAERYKIGGERLGRGFEVTEIAGDQGAGGKIELRRALAGAAMLQKASLYGFYDFGATWKQNGGERESASSSGVGFALEYGHISGFVEVAKPLTKPDVEGDSDAKVFAELHFKF
jgi:hemolysin activation/secretion protein